LTKKCQISRKKKECQYFKEDDKDCGEVDWSPWDIEELNKFGEEHKFCPYYLSNERIEGADIIFLPYNYILDNEILMKYDINITNSILIFDEAHNLAQAAEKCNSFEISDRELDQCESELISIDSELMKNYLDLDSSFTILRQEV